MLGAVEWMEAVKNGSIIIVSVSGIIAIFVAIRGINEWRREHVGKRRIDLAEEVLALFYDARDVISAARSDMGYKGEGATRKHGENETAEQSEILDRAYVAIERLKSRQELFSRLHALRYRFMAQNGNEAAKPFLDLRAVQSKIVSASRRVSHLWLRFSGRDHTRDEYQKLDKSLREQEAIIWEGEADPDPITPEIDRIVGEIDKTCRSIISGR